MGLGRAWHPWDSCRATWSWRGGALSSSAREGITRAEGEEHLTLIKNAAPADLKAVLGALSVDGYRNGRIRVAVGAGRGREVQDWLQEAYQQGIVPRVRGATEMKVRVERSPEQKANLSIFLRGLRAVEQQLEREEVRGALAAEMQDDDGVQQGERKARPDWRRWAIMVGEVTVAQLPRGAKELTWTEAGLVAIRADSGAQVLGRLQEA